MLDNKELKPIHTPPSKTELAVKSIISKIRSGEFVRGRPIPSEDELAGMLGVSRTCIREAEKILAWRNVLYVVKGKGTYIVERNCGVLSDPFGLMFSADKMKTARDICDIRDMIEPELAYRAANEASDEQIAKLAELNSELTKCIDEGRDHSQADAKFHVQIALCAKNDFLMNQLFSILFFGVSYLVASSDHELYGLSETFHNELFEAVLTRDASYARSCMAEHQHTNIVFLDKADKAYAMRA